MASGRFILPITEPLLDAAGLVDPGATLTIYDTGTTNLSAIYSDPTLVTPMLNPQTANAAGRFYTQATVIWADSTAAYDALVSFTDGSSLTFEQIYLLGAATNVSGFAPIDSPAFTGVPTAPTPASNDNSNKIATTAYVQNQGYAPLNSPTFTGTPAGPTAAANTNTTQLATTAFVHTAAAGTVSLIANGSAQLPGGLVLQWGLNNTSITGANQSVTVTFPIAFPTACFGIQCSINNSGAANSIANVMATVSLTTTTATVRSNGYQSSSYTAVPGFYWLAYGH